ncbi:MAG: hypothetical protein VX737_03745 [Pseudomonadota bacterium]|nr:hypothetical protein [Pseudomonadota bacterium]
MIWSDEWLLGERGVTGELVQMHLDHDGFRRALSMHTDIGVYEGLNRRWRGLKNKQDYDIINKIHIEGGQ